MLKSDFNDIFIKNGKNPQLQDEVTLFRALIEVMNKRHFAYAKEYHGYKGHVEHLLQYPHDLSSDRVRRCEIADVLLLIMDNDGNMRYTFLQNKRDKKSKYISSVPLRRVKADPIQWDLLHYRCFLSNPMETGLPQNCLSSAILNSAATYGIFINEASSNYVDMSYNIARDLTPVISRRISKRTHNRAYNISTDYNRLNFVDGYWEIEGTTTLDDFERAAQAMFVGSPIEANNPKHIEFAKCALSYAYTCLRNQRRNNDFQVNHESYYINLFRCAEKYNVNVENENYLPYDLVVIKAKNKFFATNRTINCNIFNDCKIIYDKEDIYSKIGDEDSIVIIDQSIVDDALKVCLSVSGSKNWFLAEPCDGGILLTNSFE